jgi:O-antigen ligase
VAVQNVLGFTRAHYLALGIALPVLVLVAFADRRGRSKLTQAAPFVGLAVLAAYAFVPSIQHTANEVSNRFQEAFDSRTQSRVHREAENEAVLRDIRAEPLVGRGLGAEYLGVDPFTLRPAVVHFVHNDYLALWLRGGLPLVGVWTAMLGHSIWTGLRKPSQLGGLVGAGAAAGLLGIAVTAIASGSAFGYVAGPITALLAVVATSRAAPERVPSLTDEDGAPDAGSRWQGAAWEASSAG